MLVHFLALSTRLCMTGGFSLHYFILLLFSPWISFIFFISLFLALSGPLTFSIIFLILILWNLYGADCWQAQLGFSLRTWQTSLPPWACWCWLLTLSKKKPLHHLDSFLRKVCLFLNTLPAVYSIYITSILWDSNVEHGEKDRENNQSKLATLRSLPDSALCLSKPGKLSVKKFQQHVPEHCGVHIFHPLPSALQ